MIKRDLSKPEGSALKYDRDLYDTSVSPLVFTEREARAEYARLRRAANARLETLQRHGLGDSYSLRRFPSSFESLAGASEKEVRKGLKDVAHFMDLQTTSYRGQQKARQNMINALQERGLDWIDKTNVDAFGKFMETVKKHYGTKKSYDSEQYVIVFKEHEEELKKKDYDALKEWFDEWKANEDQKKVPDYTEEDLEPARPRPAERTRSGRQDKRKTAPGQSRRPKRRK